MRLACQREYKVSHSKMGLCAVLIFSLKFDTKWFGETDGWNKSRGLPAKVTYRISDENFIIIQIISNILVIFYVFDIFSLLSLFWVIKLILNRSYKNDKCQTAGSNSS